MGSVLERIERAWLHCKRKFSLVCCSTLLVRVTTSDDLRSKPIIDDLKEDLDGLEVLVWTLSGKARVTEDLPEQHSKRVDLCLLSEVHIFVLQELRGHVRNRPRWLVLTASVRLLRTSCPTDLLVA